MLHRPLPSDAVVKRVDWRGVFHPIHGWQWAVALILKVAVNNVDSNREPVLRAASILAGELEADIYESD